MNNLLIAKLEAILFVSSRPVKKNELVKVLKINQEELEEGLQFLLVKFNTNESGINISIVDEKVNMISNSEYADVCKNFIKMEAMGELTRAQLETLTVIAYRGPVTRAELEKIRGVNCAVIVRNLMLRGLIEEKVLPDLILPAYVLSSNALSGLGITSVEQLLDYEKMSKHDNIEAVLGE